MDLHRLLHVLDTLEEHESTAARTINMVPSENSMSTLAKLPLVLDTYHRYFFNVTGADDEWNFRGAQDVAFLETEFAVGLLQELARAPHVNVRPLSGLSGMMLVLASLGGDPGRCVLTVAEEQGGHYATASVARRLGLRVAFMTGPDAHSMDFDQIAELVASEQPSLVYVDQSNCLFPLDVQRLVETVHAARTDDTIVHVDASHWMGLVLGRQMCNPLDQGADSFGGSMHKSFPGPQKGVFITRRPDLAERVQATQYFMISSHHFGATLSLGLSLLEFKECGGEAYALQLVRNTRELGRLLHQRGLWVEAEDRGFSAGHQLWIRTARSGLDAFAASQRLYEAGIRVNAFPGLPGIDEPVLRIGVNEASYHGLRDDDLAELADVFVEAVSDGGNACRLAERVAQLRAHYHSPYRFPRDAPEIHQRVASLLNPARG